MLTTLPLVGRLRSRIVRRDMLAMADDVDVLHPVQRRWAPPAIFLPDELDRVISCTPQSSPSLEKQRLSEGWHEHGATIVRSFRNAVLLDGCVYAKGGYLDIQQTKRRLVNIAAWEGIDNALVCSTNVDCRYFGHWPTDVLPLEMLAGQLSVEPVSVAKPRWQHEHGYRALLGMANRPVAAARFETLRIADDRGMNDHRIARHRALRRHLVDALETPAATMRPVFIARGATAIGRSLTNEAALTEALARDGFVILQPENEDAATIARTMRNASMVVAVEGSAQSHAILGAPSSTPFVTIMPPRQINSVWKPYCDMLDMPYGFTVADDAGVDRFHQPIDRLRRLIDRMPDTS